MSLIEMHAIISGHVQGVCFRATVYTLAKQLSVAGTVKNLPDGTVELYAQGTRQQLDQLLMALHHKFGSSYIHSIEKWYSAIEKSRSRFDIIF